MGKGSDPTQRGEFLLIIHLYNQVEVREHLSRYESCDVLAKIRFNDKVF